MRALGFSRSFFGQNPTPNVIRLSVGDRFQEYSG